MSEYWKSTPKYWCKFCKTYVRDTTLERKQHDSTPRHQNNIQKSLRELHKGRDREEREKQRAKDEVARLNALVGGDKAAAAGPSTTAPSAGPAQTKRPPPHFTREAKAQATPEERKRQLAQLAAMGIAVPEEFRRDAAMSSEWSTVSETPVYHAKPEPDIKGEDEEDVKPAVHSVGVRKRKVEDDEEADEEVLPKARKNWGSTFKSYPGAGSGEVDFDALLSGATAKKTEVKREDDEGKDAPAGLKTEDSVEGAPTLAAVPDVNDPPPPVKQEEPAPSAAVDSAAMPPIVFKKRKGAKR